MPSPQLPLLLPPPLLLACDNAALCCDVLKVLRARARSRPSHSVRRMSIDVLHFVFFFFEFGKVFEFENFSSLFKAE
jgi:hypothetical protein